MKEALCFLVLSNLILFGLIQLEHKAYFYA